MANPSIRPNHDAVDAEDDRLSDEAEIAMKAGIGIPLSEVVAWVESWDTNAELPPPLPRNLPFMRMAESSC